MYRTLGRPGPVWGREINVPLDFLLKNRKVGDLCLCSIVPLLYLQLTELDTIVNMIHRL